ncbi:hypothetical protein HPC49_31680 [Pyxidicoccus fallax]|uniref:Uncharacterized protein n=1 Tax=Pyxidicoccus fallax TaxID=394095 RepID=A0A848LV54_9BACT|nr:hypothetical protein [Pyxidicoccus fallax]NMO21490.1 hypothetical protein [Pyxidicoccus fallax]NPC82771.1 hypothetical protein [Pyxidicoccus fallax]
MSEPTRFGGHGMRGRTLFVMSWVALSLPNVLALMDAGPVPTAMGAALALAAGVGLGRVASQGDEGIGCLFALLAGGGVWLGWTLGEAWAGAPVGRHLGALGVGALLPVLLVGVRAFLRRREERTEAE